MMMESPVGGVEPGTSAQLLEEKRCRRRAKNKAKKEESRRAREEEIRRTLYEPKNRRGVRLVGAGEVALLRGTAPPPPGPPAPIATVNSQDFPHLGCSTRQHRRREEAAVTIDLTACAGAEPKPPVACTGAEPKPPVTIDLVAEPERQAKPRRAHPITIDLMSAVKKPPEPPAPRRKSPTRPLGGNQLDSSNPERRKGKTRENPRPQKPSHLKAVILADRKARAQDPGGLVGPTGAPALTRPHAIHSRKFRDYCDHVQCPELDAAVSALITDIVKFQDRLYFADPVRAHAKRRFVLGFREAGKYLAMRRLKLLVVAPDLETARSEGGIEDTVTRLRDEARAQGVPCAFSLGRATLRRLTNKSCVVKGISCVGVISYEGSQDNFHAIRDMLPALAERYRALVQAPVPADPDPSAPTGLVEPPAPTDPDINKQVVATFLDKLSKELE